VTFTRGRRETDTRHVGGSVGLNFGDRWELDTQDWDWARELCILQPLKWRIKRLGLAETVVSALFSCGCLFLMSPALGDTADQPALCIQRIIRPRSLLLLFGLFCVCSTCEQLNILQLFVVGCKVPHLRLHRSWGPLTLRWAHFGVSGGTGPVQGVPAKQNRGLDVHVAPVCEANEAVFGRSFVPRQCSWLAQDCFRLLVLASFSRTRIAAHEETRRRGCALPPQDQ
jgi:hypothetical protein